jgi:hypothetical protein
MLTSANRYAILYRIGNAKKPETRSRRIGQFVEMLARGETIHPPGSMITRVVHCSQGAPVHCRVSGTVRQTSAALNHER